MKNTNRTLILGGVGLVFLAGLVWFLNQNGQRPQMPAVEGCPGETFEFTVNDDAMAGVLDKGATVRVVKNFYKCNPVERGDLVLYRFSELRDPVVRVAQAVPGDSFKLVRSKDKVAWNIQINEELLEIDGKPFKFGSDATPVLSLYEKSSQGKLDEKTVILFGINPPYENDSTSLGALSASDIVGKVLKANESVPSGAPREAQTLEESTAPNVSESAEQEPTMNKAPEEPREEQTEDTQTEENANE